jgi:hypothetical protein
MQPHASSPLSLAQTRIDDPEQRPPAPFAPGDKSRFHEAFAKANRTEPFADTQARGKVEGPRKGQETRRSEAARDERRNENASTARRPDRADRHRADAGTERRPSAERDTATESPRDAAAARTGDEEATRDGSGERDDANAAPIRADLLAFLQNTTSPIVMAQGPLTLGAPLAGGAADGMLEGNPLAQANGAAGALTNAGTLAEAGHTSEAALNHLADAFARADRLNAGREARALEDRGAIATDGLQSAGEATQLSGEALAKLEGRRTEGAAAQALATGHAHGGKREAPPVTAGETKDPANAGETSGTAGAVAAAAGGSARAGARSGNGNAQGEDTGHGADERLARDAFTASAARSEEAATTTPAHGAFGSDPRVQHAFDGTRSPEARLEQAKAASEHILERIERLTEQRAAGREMVIATERGPVRVKVEVAEKNVSVQFRAEDDQLKNLLRSGLPALQATLAKRGFASTDFQFDGEDANDLMANGGGAKHAEARAIRESLLGEAMIEPVVLEGTKTSTRDPRALLSVTA